MTWKQFFHALKEVIVQNRQAFCGFSAFAIIIFSLVFIATKTTTVSNTVGDRELPIYCVETAEKKVALSFDAAWGNEDTTVLLEILRKHHVHVTFFMTGGWVEKYPDDVKAILADGHDLGNHSENHKDMTQLSNAEVEDELMKVHNKVKELTGYEMFLFRPPYGAYDNHVVNDAKAAGYYTIQWDVEPCVTGGVNFQKIWKVTINVGLFSLNGYITYISHF